MGVTEVVLSLTVSPGRLVQMSSVTILVQVSKDKRTYGIIVDRRMRNKGRCRRSPTELIIVNKN